MLLITITTPDTKMSFQLTRSLIHLHLPSPMTTTSWISSTLHHQAPLLPIASTSKLASNLNNRPRYYSSPSSSSSPSQTNPSKPNSTSTRKIYGSATTQPIDTGFDIPPPVFEGRIEVLSENGKGKAKAASAVAAAADQISGLGLGMQHAVKEEPRRKVSIKSKKAAITMVCFIHFRSGSF